MDLNQSMEFDLESADPSVQVENVVPMNSSMLPYHQTTKEMISSETPILFSKACELFILELTLRAWLQTTDCKRRTLQRCDISRAIRQENMLNFLNRVVPCDNQKEDEVAKCIEEMESLPNMQMPFPFLDLNGEFMMDQNNEDPQQLMTKPPIPSSDFTFGSASKVNVFKLFETISLGKLMEIKAEIKLAAGS
ncbi:unnamed protein product [Dovyalis caffra]|uniref:Core Histone H2A/H2B/H3 domain-containing protein n=1 Tax=Dovyalis caffra TaxID=77055 RepID=A0AAV1S3E1_9ROSI|nr:unnamed protein product [Dovyalis caffra]